MKFIDIVWSCSHHLSSQRQFLSLRWISLVGENISLRLHWKPKRPLCRGLSTETGSTMKTKTVQLTPKTCANKSSSSSSLPPASVPSASPVPSPPLQPKRSSVVINLDKNKINLRRPHSRLFVRPLSLQHNLRALRLFPPVMTTAAAASPTDERIDIAFIKELEEDIYRTKAEALAASVLQQLKHEESCFCCGKKDYLSRASLAEPVIQDDSCSVSSEHEVRLRQPPIEQSNTNNIHRPWVRVVDAKQAQAALVRPQSHPSARRSSKIKWPFMRRRPARENIVQRMIPSALFENVHVDDQNGSVQRPSAVWSAPNAIACMPKCRSRSWPTLPCRPIPCVHANQPLLLALAATHQPRSKFISRSCDNLLIALPVTGTVAASLTLNGKTTATSVTQRRRRWPWLNLIYLWRRRNSRIHRKQTHDHGDNVVDNDAADDVDDNCMQISRIPINNNERTMAGCANASTRPPRDRRSFSMHLKRHSSAATSLAGIAIGGGGSGATSRSMTSTTDTVKAWVYRRRFLSHTIHLFFSCFFVYSLQIIRSFLF